MTSDDELRAKLRSLDSADADTELGNEHAEALRARIVSSARRTMAARQRRSMWDYSARWARAAVPVGLAASILAAAALLRAPDSAGTNPNGTETVVTYEYSDDDPAGTLRNFASGQVGSAEMLDSLVGPATRDALYSRVLRGAQ